MKHIGTNVCFCLLLFMLMCICAISVYASGTADADENVIFLDGSGSDTNSGITPSHAVASLSRAVELLNGEGGVIVLCGDLEETTGITIPAQTGKLLLTGSYGGTNYHATLSFGGTQNQANKNIVFQSEAEMEHFKQELVEYLDYYNNRRIKAKLKGLPPAIHRQQALSAA